MKKLLAFTLAETLVVIGIIGVVSALTIPNLNGSTGEKEKVAKLQKLYSNLNDAFGRAVIAYGPVKGWFVGVDASTATDRLKNRTAEFMKVSKDCDKNTVGCFPKIDNTTNYWFYNKTDSARSVILADGTSLIFGLLNGSCTVSYGDVNNICAAVYVDVDGMNKGKQAWGNDIFEFDINAKGEVFPVGSFQDCVTTQISTRQCAKWVIENGNADYLKADRSGKCPNGTVLSETVTSCK